jgi:hypothetical protein
MAKVVIYLPDKEMSALHRLALLEYRAPKAQAALIIRKELERLGLVAPEANGEGEKNTPPAGEAPTSKEGILNDGTSS